jgi:hypothetical protein
VRGRERGQRGVEEEGKRERARERLLTKSYVNHTLMSVNQTRRGGYTLLITATWVVEREEHSLKPIGAKKVIKTLYSKPRQAWARGRAQVVECLLWVQPPGLHLKKERERERRRRRRSGRKETNQDNKKKLGMVVYYVISTKVHGCLGKSVRPYLKNKLQAKRAGGMAQMTERLPGKCRALYL